MSRFPVIFYALLDAANKAPNHPVTRVINTQLKKAQNVKR